MNPIIFQQVQNIEDELRKLQQQLFTLQSTDLSNSKDQYESVSTNAALRAERITCQLRNLVYIANPYRKESYLNLASNAQGINISSENDVLKITMPGLLPKRRVHTNTAFLHEPLNYALQKYLRKNPIELYEYCVVCFDQIYDHNLSKQRIRDYDNLEFKQILDTIATYVLLDDSGLFCDLYHTTDFGKTDATVIYIMNQSVFSDWITTHKKQIQHISDFS